MAIKNFTTTVDAFKTLSEIQQLLSKKGALKQIIDNDAKGNPIALMFTLDWGGRMVYYQLPCNFEGVLKAMQKDRSIPRSKCTQEQALRVGWRIIKDWIAAQIAIAEADVASMAEVFLPYAVTKEGETLFKYLQKDKTLLQLGQG